MIKITIIGYGKVGKKLFDIFSKNSNLECSVLSSKKNIGVKNIIKNYGEIAKDNIVFLCVPDDKIAEVSDKIDKSIPVVHCSGATPLSTLRQTQKGVFYPLQSFGNKKIDETQIPILLESNNKDLLEKLKTMAKFTLKVVVVNSQKRLLYHLNAVILNNFTNYLFMLSKEFSDKNDLEFSYFKPLIDETIKRLENNNPKEVQTGPAARGDNDTINRHIEILKNNARLKMVYQLFSEMIKKDFT